MDIEGRLGGQLIIRNLNDKCITTQFQKQARRNLNNLYQRKDGTLLQFVVRVRKACYTVYYEDQSPVNGEWRKLVLDGFFFLFQTFY